ncbi:MAG TPA: DinB family protein [Dehalococcoidia bacterium]|nr:DinB family protein [Dehalococcoidia bacterium]
MAARLVAYARARRRRGAEDAMDTLRELFRHHAWATLRLVEYCASLPAAALREPATGAYGPILPTLVHLVAAEQRYLSRLPGEPPRTPLREGMEPPLAELRAIVEEQAQRWEALLDRGAALSVTMPAQPDGWPETPHAETLLMLQTLHHGNDHRTQISTILGAHGRDGPSLDGWDYWETAHFRRA